MVTETDAEAEGLGVLIQDLAAYFYAENGLVASIQSERLMRGLTASQASSNG